MGLRLHRRIFFGGLHASGSGAPYHPPHGHEWGRPRPSGNPGIGALVAAVVVVAALALVAHLLYD